MSGCTRIYLSRLKKRLIYHVFITIPAKDVGMRTIQGLHPCPVPISLFYSWANPDQAVSCFRTQDEPSPEWSQGVLHPSWSRPVSGNTGPKGTELRCRLVWLFVPNPGIALAMYF